MAGIRLKIHCLNVAVICGVLALARPAEAATVTWDFAATVSISGVYHAAGDSITGSFTYDSSTPGVFPLGQGIYLGAITSFRIDQFFSGPAVNSVFAIEDNFDTGTNLEDAFVVFFEDGATKQFSIQGVLDSAKPTAINSVSLPLLPYNVSAFDSVQVIYSSSANDTVVGFTADVDSITLASTPLPAALPLFASGCALLGFLGWRRKRKSAA
jgi:hypothetical protein